MPSSKRFLGKLCVAAWLAARLPAALKIVGTSLLLIPLSPLFMAPLEHGGVLAELHTLLPKLVLS